MQPKTAVRAATAQVAMPVFKLLRAPLLLPLNEEGEESAELELAVPVPEVAPEGAPVAVLERVTPNAEVEVAAVLHESKV